jgi:hypothetical protein
VRYLFWVHCRHQVKWVKWVKCRGRALCAGAIGGVRWLHDPITTEFSCCAVVTFTTAAAVTKALAQQPPPRCMGR